MTAENSSTDTTWLEFVKSLDWTNIVQIGVTDSGIFLSIGYLTLLVAVGLFASIWLFRPRRRFGKADLEEINLSLGGIGSIKIKPNSRNIQIAHEAWVEITTRKASVQVDKDHDVIIEIYDSFYHLFSELRQLTKSIPAQTLRADSETMKLVKTLTDIMNVGLRPHLTRWQAPLRDWHRLERDKDPKEDVLSIQRRFPELKELTKDLEQVQGEMATYVCFLGRIAHGRGAAS